MAKPGRSTAKESKIKSRTGYTALKQVAVAKPTTYWYKINGKPTTKAGYNAYVNKPGGDEGGKTTNDPDASGNKARTMENRKKLNTSKKKSPLEFDWKSALDTAQTGLMGAGMIPGYGNIADGINTAISAGRAGYAKYKGDEEGYKEHRNNAAVNATMMIPGIGQTAATAKLTSMGLKEGSKHLAKNVIKKTPKVIAKDQAKKTAGKVQSEVDKANAKLKAEKDKKTITINSKNKSDKNHA